MYPRDNYRVCACADTRTRNNKVCFLFSHVNSGLLMYNLLTYNLLMYYLLMYNRLTYNLLMNNLLTYNLLMYI